MVTHQPAAQRFELTEHGETAYLSYTLLPDGTYDFRHTVVPPPIGGRGIGTRLVQTALAHARAHGWPVRPSCSFVRTYIEHHPEYGDLLHRPHFSIVIITLNEEENIAKLLGDLQAQTFNDFEVIVSDSNSDDDTLAVARRFSGSLNLRTVAMKARGVGLGRNAGAAEARANRLIFFDADVRLDADFLARARRALDNSGLLVAAARLRSRDPSWRIRAAIRSADWIMRAMQFWFPQCAGACIFSTQTVHRHLGGFDETITLGEDCDYVNRASKSFRFRILPVYFEFHPRRLKQDGLLAVGLTYLRGAWHRLTKGEIRNHAVPYQQGHYRKNEPDSRR
ncbi:N-acetyltransferase [Eikenella sp. Marseille-P7795]|uniref:N-acetyltransferase n=1 Tax=Eikenella sp. Marseille-P7795 TaxID=2866577 RepID=UPI001CE470CB|nr:N-acetyltransferase [Eikenella sp. Marseille-P7795]